LNYYTWLRGSKGTYDEWQEYGGSTWSWDNCLGYFQKVHSSRAVQWLYADTNRSVQLSMITTISSTTTQHTSEKRVH
jgi:choline dehydrogenase-like flavoprotein